ncbi:hypothetical protein WBP07_20130 (plasmid) [Novosphingobium sp. BL-8A]|uniref:hypothetical protein n=1 Tax=Novosphingobium sp. BL-8A TaxID=3127639 RepID=UPI003757B2A4
MHTEKQGTEKHLDKIEARAGSRNKTNRNALVAGLILVVIVFAVIVGFGFFQADRTGADEVTSQNAAADAGKH